MFLLNLYIRMESIITFEVNYMAGRSTTTSNQNKLYRLAFAYTYL